MNINNMTSHNRSTEIREITSIVPPSPTDTNHSGEGRIRRIEEHNLAAHHAPLFKICNRLWSSATPFKCVLCWRQDVQRRRGKGHVSAQRRHWVMVGVLLVWVAAISAVISCSVPPTFLGSRAFPFTFSLVVPGFFCCYIYINVEFSWIDTNK